MYVYPCHIPAHVFRILQGLLQLQKLAVARQDILLQAICLGSSGIDIIVRVWTPLRCATMEYEAPARSTQLSKLQVLLLLAMGIPPILCLGEFWKWELLPQWI